MIREKGGCKKILLRFISILSFFISGIATAAPPYDPTDDLIAAFGNQCSSSGDLTNAALAQSSALKGVVASLRDDPACQGIIPMADSLDADILAHQQARITSGLSRDEIASTVANLQAAIQVERAKGAAADQNYIAALNTELYNDQITLLKAQANIDTIPKKKPYEMMASFYNHSTALLDSLAANAACLNKHPNILAQVGAQVLKLSSEWASGLAGSALLAAGGIVDHFVQFIRNYEINKDLRNLMSARMEHAIGCTLEGLASTYCRSRDTQLIIEANRNFQNADQCTTITQGTNLLARDLGAFTDFVQGIYAGSRASSPPTASEKNTVVYLIANLQSLQITLDGDTAKYEKNYNSNPDVTNREATIRSLIRTLSQDVSNQMNATRTSPGGGMSITYGPIGDAFVLDPDCGVMSFFYSGGQYKGCKRTVDETTSSTGCELCVKRVHPELPLPTIADIRTTSSKVLDLGNIYVAQQVKLYKQNNPQLALTTSETYGQNLKQARQFLEDARAYLKHLVDESDGIAKGHMLKTIKAAQSRIDDILKVLDDSAKDPTSKPEDVAAQLSGLLAPSSDVNYIPNEISIIVKQDIDVKLNQGKMDPNLALVLRSSTSDSLSQLLSNYGSLENIRNQVRGAKRMTKANLETVGHVFNDQIDEILKRLSKESENDDAAKEELSLFCIQLLLVPDAPKIKDGPDVSRFCKNRMYWSLYTKTGLRLDFNTLASQKYDERACSIYDFYRKAHLYGIGVSAR